MEKVPRSKKEIEQALIPIKPYYWIFTEDEKQDIKDNLPGYDHESVESFTCHLEILCHIAKDLHENPTRSEFRSDNQKLLNQLKKSLNLLEGIEDTKTPLHLPTQIDFLQSDELYHHFDVALRASTLASQAIEPLAELVELIEKCTSVHTNLKSGRPFADAIGLTHAIAELFNKTFGEIPKHSGPFAVVVSIARVAIGLDPDPSRSIRAVLHPQS